MKRASFTSGPWLVSYGPWPTLDNSRILITKLDESEEREVLATLGHHDDEDVANAHLIAESPRLYLCLSEMLDLIDRLHPESMSNDDQDAIARARLILASARGGK